jgi:hypothetical protein
MTDPASKGQIAGRILLTLVISAIGGLLAQALGIPAGLIMGGAVSVAIAALAGIPVLIPSWLRNIGFVLIGTSMGATVARDSLSLIAQWPVTLAAMAIELVIIISSTGYMLRKLFKLDPGTAYLSSFPGHLSFVMGIASAGVGDARQIAIIQVIRILMLTVCVPIATFALPVAHFEGAPTPAPISLENLAAVALASALAGYGFSRLRIPAGYVLGAMAVSTTARLSGLFEGSMPEPLVGITFVLVGALIGSRFSGITRGEFMSAATGGLIATAMTVGIVTVIAFLVSFIVDMPLGQIWIALSPGALEGMGATAVALGYDTAFVAAHHVARLLMLTFAIPLVVLLVRSKERSASAVSASGREEGPLKPPH